MKATDTILEHLLIHDFQTYSGLTQPIELSYQLFGPSLHSAPVVLVNHALTGNSNVAGASGWWSALIGEGKCIDTTKYTVLAFNIPGNGYDGFVIDNYKDFVARDIAQLFLQVHARRGPRFLVQGMPSPRSRGAPDSLVDRKSDSTENIQRSFANDSRTIARTGGGPA